MRLGSLTSERRARELLPPFVLACGVTLFLAPVAIVGRAFFLKDALLWFYPSRLYLRARMLEGDLPQWIPELDMGSPFLADPGNGALYPLNLLLLLPAPACVGQFLVAHVILAALGAYALLRALDVRPTAAFTGGVGYGLGGYLLSMTWSGLYLLSIAWMPLVLYLAVRLLRQTRLREVALLGIAMGCQILTGEAQGAGLTLVLMVALLLALARSWRRRGLALAGLAFAGVIAVGLALPQILPTLDLLSTSERAGGLGLQEAQHWSMHPLRLLELLVPWLFGDPTGVDERFLGFFMNDEGEAFHRTPWMISPYLGSLCLALAVVGAATPDRRHRRWTLAVLLVGVLALLLALGRHLPFFGLFFEVVPGANIFRYPAKYFALLALILPLLAAAGLDSALREHEEGRARALRTLAAATGCLLTVLVVASVAAPWIGGALAAGPPEVTAEVAIDVVRRALTRETLVFGALCLGLWLVWRLRPPSLGHALAAAVVVQLVVQNLDVARTVDAGVYEELPPLARAILATGSDGGVPRVWRLPLSSGVGRHVAVSPLHRALQFTDTLEMNTGIARGIGYASAYSASSASSRQRLWDATESIQKPTMDLFSMKYVVVPRGVSVPEGIGLELLARSASGSDLLYRNRRALPLVRGVHRAISVQTFEGALEGLRRPEVYLGGTVLLEGPVTSPPSGGDVQPTACVTERPTRDTLRARCNLAAPGWIVINEGYNGGWTASLDGVDVPLQRANGVVMATAAGEGRHLLSLSYEEPSLLRGLIVALVTILLCSILFVGTWWRSRVSSTGERPG